jgi:hypothetical protein
VQACIVAAAWCDVLLDVLMDVLLDVLSEVLSDVLSDVLADVSDVADCSMSITVGLTSSLPTISHLTAPRNSHPVYSHSQCKYTSILRTFFCS